MDNEFKEKCAILARFIEQWSHLPPQRSVQWKNDRTFSIGASEIGTLLGQNKYQTTKVLILSHCELFEILERVAMDWGVVMEQVVLNIAEEIFDCEIHEMGSIPTVGVQSQRCSPDGVAVVRMLGNRIISFEFKAPLRRVPRGGIPDAYRSQVKACLCAVEPADLGIYVDTAMRRCGSADWTFANANYDQLDPDNCDAFHTDTTFRRVAGLSSVYFFSTEHTGPPAEPINFGESTSAEFADLLAACTCNGKKIARKYGRLYLAGRGHSPNLFAEVAEHASDATFIGFLPIKIFKIEVVPVLKEPDFVLRHVALIDDVISIIRLAMAEADLTTRKKIIDTEAAKRRWMV